MKEKTEEKWYIITFHSYPNEAVLAKTPEEAVANVDGDSDNVDEVIEVISFKKYEQQTKWIPVDDDI